MSAWRTTLQTRWQTLQARERQMVAWGGALLFAALLWWVAIAPALHTLRDATVQHQQLGAQIQRMLQQQRVARQLQEQPIAPRHANPRALQESVQAHFGFKAKVELSGQQAQVSLQGVSSNALSHWLRDLRENAEGEVKQALLQRAPPDSNGLWQGTITVALP